MQKVLARNAQHIKQANSRLRQRTERNRRTAKALRLHEQRRINASIRSDIYAARTARREDWLLGPLAPRRDVGDHKETYGTVETVRLRAVEQAKGAEKWYGIREGDRVCVIQGSRDKGKIGRVREVRDRGGECVVEGVNRVDVAVPEYMLAAETDKTPYRTMEAPIPLSSVRLVYPLPDPTTGARRDVIIKELVKIRGHRHIAGTSPSIFIPWPDKPPEKYDDHDNDTLRIDVEERTWVPSLQRMPMPESVLNELRNPYSRFRTRHDEDFVEKKTMDVERELRKKGTLQDMMTPMQELHAKRKAEKEAKGPPILEDEILARIGEVMAKNKVVGESSQVEVQP